MESKRLLKKTGLYFIGNISSKILTFALVPIYAFYIESEDLGYYDYTQTIMNVAVPIFFVAIWEAILKYVLQEDDEREKEKVIATSCFFTIIMCIVTALAAAGYGLIASDKPEKLHFVIMMILSYALMFIWQYYARAMGHNKIYVLASMSGTAVNFISTIIMIYVLKMGIEALFVPYILGNAFIAGFLEIRLKIFKKLKKENIDAGTLKKMLLFSAPLVLNLTSTWLISGFGRKIITDKMGYYDNGLYAFANRFAIVITMLGSVINMAIIEEALVSAKKEGIGKSFINTMETLFKIFQSMIIAAIPIILIFYFMIRHKDYYASRFYAPGLLLYAFFMIMTTSFGTVFQVISKTKYQFITTAMGAAATVAIAYGFIERAGIHAVVLAQVIGAVVMLISRYIFINMYVEFKIKWLPILLMLAAYVISAFICLNVNVAVTAAVFVISCIVLGYINRDFIKKAVGMIRNKM